MKNKISNDLWRKALIEKSSSIKDVIENLNNNAVKIAIVVNNKNELEGVISDGDIRRALLKGFNLSDSILSVMRKKPLVVTSEVGIDAIKKLMHAKKIQQIPIVDKKNKVIGLHFWDQIFISPIKNNIMVIMAGGKGKRLLPHTLNCPKPMVLVSGKPILLHIIERAKEEGISHFIIAINYLGHIIEKYFGDGSKFGAKVEYLKEDKELGTAGALSLLNKKYLKESFIVTNGDVVTDIKYNDLLNFHDNHNVRATMAVKSFEWQNPYGVVTLSGSEIINFSEKPILKSYINAGIYVLDFKVLSFLKKNEYCDMPTLFERLKIKKQRIIAYPIHEPWLDIGSAEDLLKAQSDFKNA
jgi:dTDP-glucose pyrophosphorylase